MMNELKPEDTMKALECHATDYKPPMEGVFHCKTDCPYHQFDFCTKVLAQDALALLRENKATLEMCAEVIQRQDKELARKDALLEEWDAKCKDYETALIGKCMDIEKLKQYCDEKDAEIERLHRVSAETNDRNFRLLEATKKSCEARINLAIREAITEFAENVKMYFETYPENEEAHALYVRSLVDQIAKEMKGETE